MTNEMNIFDIPVHPAADAFPVMEEEELEELAADIKINGLKQPLVVAEVDGQMMLIDGRTRRMACLALGIIPGYVLLDGQDPVAYIMSANIHRRHMTKGQRAMVMARLLETSKVTQQTASKQADISQQRISQARTILKHAPDLADSVISGFLPLDNAYEEARIRKGRADTYESRFNALKAEAPDLAELVVEERLGLEEAQVALGERKTRIQREKIGIAEGLHALAQHAYFLEHEVQRKRVAEFVVSEAELYQKHNPDPIDEVIHALEVFERHAGHLLGLINQLKMEKASA